MRYREVEPAPTEEATPLSANKSRESEFPPTEKLNDFGPKNVTFYYFCGILKGRDSKSTAPKILLKNAHNRIKP